MRKYLESPNLFSTPCHRIGFSSMEYFVHTITIPRILKPSPSLLLHSKLLCISTKPTETLHTVSTWPLKKGWWLAGKQSSVKWSSINFTTKNVWQLDQFYNKECLTVRYEQCLYFIALPILCLLVADLLKVFILRVFAYLKFILTITFLESVSKSLLKNVK